MITHIHDRKFSGFVGFLSNWGRDHMIRNCWIMCRRSRSITLDGKSVKTCLVVEKFRIRWKFNIFGEWPIKFLKIKMFPKFVGTYNVFTELKKKVSKISSQFFLCFSELSLNFFQNSFTISRKFPQVFSKISIKIVLNVLLTFTFLQNKAIKEYMYFNSQIFCKVI